MKWFDEVIFLSYDLWPLFCFHFSDCIDCKKKEMSPKPFFVFVWRLKTSICWKAICLTYFAINKIWSSITQEDAGRK
jgi:hypothetical protein